MANVSTIVIISSVPYPELFWSWYTGLGSQTQIPKCSKVLISGVSFCQRSLSREQCFELFRTQNSQKVPGFCPWTPLGRAYSTTPDSPAAQQFFSSLRLLKNWHPQKLLDMALISHVKYIWQSLLIMVDFDALSSLWFPPWSSCFEASCLRVIAEVLKFSRLNSLLWSIQFENICRSFSWKS